MSEKEGLDISKVVGLIMENPALIEQISALAKQKTVEEAEQKVEEAKPVSTDTYPTVSVRSERARLLGALKPYVSSERAKAIDSVISIADILDVMRSR